MQGEANNSALPGARLAVSQQLLPYNASLASRRLADVDLVVIHCTELPSLALAREFGEHVVHEKSGTGNAGHFYIDRDGLVYQWLELERVAHHVRGMNRRSVGIELVNTGRYPDWFRSDRQALTDPYPDAQIAALKALLDKLQALIPSLAWIAGHEELDTECIPAEDEPTRMIRRKVDPGPLFPWKEVAASVSLSRWRMETVDE